MTGDYKANKYIFSHRDHIGISIRVKNWKGHSLERDLWEHKVHKSALQNWLASGGAYVLKQRDRVSFWQHFHNTSLWSGSRAWRTHAHTFEVVMHFSKIAVSMLANKSRPMTFTTSFAYHRNLSAWLVLQYFPSNTDVYAHQWSDKTWLAVVGADNFTRPTQWEEILMLFYHRNLLFSWLEFTHVPFGSVTQRM